MPDKAFVGIVNCRKAQDLSDSFAVTELNARLDWAVERDLPDLAPLGRAVGESVAQRYSFPVSAMPG